MADFLSWVVLAAMYRIWPKGHLLLIRLSFFF
jgi:hypothetical protein